MQSTSNPEHIAGQAMAHAIARYTFGIIQNDRFGREGRGIGTGFGVVWRGNFLILTAGHTLRQTPDEMLYYLLPSLKGISIAESATSVDWTKFSFQARVQIEKPNVLLSADEVNDDLAAVVLPPQPQAVSERHFYGLDENHTTPRVGCPVAFLGYPAAQAEVIGDNYAAMPYYDCGEICEGVPDKDYNPNDHLLIDYPRAGDVDPHGLSGSGIWCSRSSGLVWSPSLRLAGLLTHYFDDKRALRGYRVETVIAFLLSKRDWLAST